MVSMRDAASFLAAKVGLEEVRRTLTEIFNQTAAPFPGKIFSATMTPMRNAAPSQIPLGRIRAVARRIGRQLRPRKVILFGSYASGHATVESDVDLLVIMPSRRRPAARAAVVSRLLDPRPFAVDILVRTPREVARRVAMRDSFIEDILQHGKVLYEA